MNIENSVKPVRLFLPGRIDLIGGWSDQVYWPFESAVVNCSIGWLNHHDSQYPFSYDSLGFHSCIDGFGTGLGVSSILEAGRDLFDNPDDHDYVAHVLKKEEEEGTKGGWQDQMGAIEPGFKLLTSSDHKTIKIARRDDHPIMEHVVLFDTGMRRRSQATGDKIRQCFGTEAFDSSLKHIVSVAKESLSLNAEEFAKASLECWAILNSFVNADVVGIPQSEMVWGHKLIGAGGGGYGIVYVKNPADREKVVELFRKNKMWATVPFVLQGAKYLWD